MLTFCLKNISKSNFDTSFALSLLNCVLHFYSSLFLLFFFLFQTKSPTGEVGEGFATSGIWLQWALLPRQQKWKKQCCVRGSEYMRVWVINVTEKSYYKWWVFYIMSVLSLTLYELKFNINVFFLKKSSYLLHFFSPPRTRGHHTWFSLLLFNTSTTLWVG